MKGGPVGDRDGVVGGEGDRPEFASMKGGHVGDRDPWPGSAWTWTGRLNEGRSRWGPRPGTHLARHTAATLMPQ